MQPQKLSLCGKVPLSLCSFLVLYFDPHVIPPTIPTVGVGSNFERALVINHLYMLQIDQ